MIVTKRAYDPAVASDGYRVLIDRLWPRGVSKVKAHLNAWEKDIAPSSELREWYEHDRAKWPEFQKRYKQELKTPAAKALLDDLTRRAKRGRVTLVYASKVADISDVAVLEKLLSQRVKSTKAAKSPKTTRSAKPSNRKSTSKPWLGAERSASAAEIDRSHRGMHAGRRTKWFSREVHADNLASEVPYAPSTAVGCCCGSLRQWNG